MNCFSLAEAEKNLRYCDTLRPEQRREGGNQSVDPLNVTWSLKEKIYQREKTRGINDSLNSSVAHRNTKANLDSKLFRGDIENRNRESSATVINSSERESAEPRGLQGSKRVLFNLYSSHQGKAFAKYPDGSSARKNG